MTITSAEHDNLTSVSMTLKRCLSVAAYNLTGSYRVEFKVITFGKYTGMIKNIMM